MIKPISSWQAARSTEPRDGAEACPLREPGVGDPELGRVNRRRQSRLSAAVLRERGVTLTGRETSDEPYHRRALQLDLSPRSR
jgi:hypothetical protein